MGSFEAHLFVCCNHRELGHRRGCCDPEGTEKLRAALKAELKKQGLTGSRARANFAGCLDQCEHGPVIVIYPAGVWYGRVQIEDVPRIVTETLIGGHILSDLLISDECLNNPSCSHCTGS